MRYGMLALVVVLPATFLAFAKKPASVRSDAQGGAAPAKAAFDTNAAACGKCHKEIYEQWKASRHSHSWTSETYHAWAKLKKKPERDCHKCHAPEEALTSAPKRPKLRANARAEGVGCACCHVADGKVHGPHGKQTEAHPTVKSDLHQQTNVDLCMSCHRVAPTPVKGLGSSYKKFVAKDKDKRNCKTCHMPEAEGYSAVDPETGKPQGEKRKIRSHRYLGSSSPEMAKKAFGLEVVQKDGKHVMQLHNKAGHRLPGLTLRSYRVTYELLDKDGKVLASQEKMITAKTKKTLWENSSLDAEFDAPAGLAKSRVKVNYLFARLKKDEPKDMGVVFTAEK